LGPEPDVNAVGDHTVHLLVEAGALVGAVDFGDKHGVEAGNRKKNFLN
jgi:hypothetical protein